MTNTLSLIDELEQVVALKDAEISSREPYYFLTHFCHTLNEHDTSGDPFHLIPEKEYLQDLCDLFLTENLLVIYKSRQMMVSWWAMGMALWYTMTRPGTRTFIMSKKEKDADAMIERIKIMYERLPETIKAKYPVNRPMTYNKLEWGKTSSIIQGLAQGPDQVRQYTASLIIMDEAAFQERAEETYTALRPSLTGGGKLVVISTPNGKNWFYRCVKDKFE